jgi:hypothetical protein
MSPAMRSNGVGLDREVRRVTAERVVAVDWSGDRSEAGQRRKIWAGVWTMNPTQGDTTALDGAPGAGKVDGGRVTLEGGRTRAEVGEWLIAMARETPRMVVGLDFCFSFPAWFVRGELGCEDGPAFWELVAGGLGEQWLARGNPDRRFWGKHPKPAEFRGDGLHRMLRATDIDCKLAARIPEAERAERVRGIGPKSVFQIGGAGSVGTASLRGMPVLRRLREAGFASVALRPGGTADGGGDVHAAEYGAGAEVECDGTGGLFAEEAQGGCSVCGAVSRRAGEGTRERGRLRRTGELHGDDRAERGV